MSMCPKVFLVLSVCLLAGPRAGGSVPGSDDLSGFMPLAKGASWSWSWQHDAALLGGNIHLTARRPVQAGEHTVIECDTLWGQREGFAYWKSHPAGIDLYPNAYLGGLRGVGRDQPTPILRGPLTVGHAWEWTSQGSVQISGDGESPPQEDMEIHHRSEITAVDEAVSVPAGDFSCVRVETKSTSRYFGDSTVTRWWARDVGLVQKREAGSGGSRLTLLVERKPGTPFPSANPLHALLDHLTQLEAPRGGRVEVTHYDHASVANVFDSHFYRVSGIGTGSILYRVHGTKVLRFDALAREDWNRLLADEPSLTFRGGWTGNANQDAEQVARACAFLLGASAAGGGWPKVTIPRSTVSYDEGEDRWSVDLYSTAPESSWKREVSMFITAGQVEVLNVRYVRR